MLLVKAQIVLAVVVIAKVTKLDNASVLRHSTLREPIFILIVECIVLTLEIGSQSCVL